MNNKCVTCHTLNGPCKEIPCNELIFRPSVYGIVINDGRVLISTIKSNGKYWFPGGGIDLGEQTIDALKREFVEETGIKIEACEIIKFNERFFYDERAKQGWHAHMLIYKCKALSTQICSDEEVCDDEAIKPRWVDINTLKEEDFHDMGLNILELIKKCL